MSDAVTAATTDPHVAGEGHDAHGHHGPKWLAHPFRHARAAVRHREARNVGVPRAGAPVLQRPLRGLRRLPLVVPGDVQGREPPARQDHGRHQHDRAALLELHGGVGRSLGPARQAEGDGPLHPHHDRVRVWVLDHQVLRVPPQVRGRPPPGSLLSPARPSTSSRAARRFRRTRARSLASTS